MNDDIFRHIQERLRSAPGFESARIISASDLSGDASLRKYTRLFLRDAPIETAVFMEINGSPGPVGGGHRGLSQDDTFVELSGFLRSHGVEAPAIILDGRGENFLIVEDVGGSSLADTAENDSRASENCSDHVAALYRKAVDVIRIFQSIEFDDSCVAFQRSPSLEDLERQAYEFLEYYALPLGLKASEQDLLSRFIRRVCSVVSGHPKVLCHYDYTAHNLFVSPSGSIRVLDFQDACLESPARDIIALIDDRDSDILLGSIRHAELLEHFCSGMKDPEAARQWYLEYRMHWHLRVTGRFALLSAERGLHRYAAWIPGSIRRLSSSLKTLGSAVPESDGTIEIIERISA